MVKHTKGFKGLSKKVLSAILAASMIMTSSSFVMAAEPTEEPVPVESTANDVETTEETEVEETEVEETEKATNEVATFSEPAPATDAVGQAQVDKEHVLDEVAITVDDQPGNLIAADKTFDVPDQYYEGGTKVKPEIEITYDGKPLKEGTDYSLSYSNNTDSTAVSEKKAKVTVNFKNDYDDLDPVTATFEILQIDLQANDVTVEYAVQDAYVYTGKEIHPAVNSVKVTKGDKEYTLTADDYTVEPSGDALRLGLVDANEGLQIKIRGKGNYTNHSDASGKFNIQPADIADGTTVTVNPTAFVKNYATAAENVKKNIVVIDNGTGEEVDDYDVQWYNEETGEYSTSTKDVSFDVGTHTLRVYGKRDSVDYTGDGNFDKDSYVEVSFEIVESTSLQMKVDSALTTASFGGFNYDPDEEALVAEYTGKDYHVEAKEVKLAGLNANEVTYKVADGEWINAGEYEITVEGKNSYAGETATIPVKILPRALNTDDDKLETNIKVEASQGLSTAGGTGDLIVKVTDETLTDEDGAVLNEVVTLEEGKDYTYVTKTENDKTYVVITGIGNYTTAISEDVATYTQKVDVEEKKINIADSSITATVSGTYKYNGSEQKPGIDNVELMGADGKVIPRTRLQITYRDNINAGTGYVIISVKDENDKKYYGVREIPFEIEGEAFDEVFTLAEIKDFDKDDVKKDDIERAIRVVYQDGGATYASPASLATSNRIEVEITKDGKEVELVDGKIAGGVYSVKVTPSGEAGSGRYQGELTTTFNVVGNDLKEAGAKIADIADQVYTSEAIEPDVVVTIGNKTLVEGEDYTVSYTDNVKGGEATAIVTGIGEYSGTIEKNFNITRAAQSIVMTNPLQERDLANGSRNTKSKVCTLKLATTMADEDTKYTYKSSDLSVATVNDGKITYKGVGECTITVTAAETDSCEAASLDIAVKVGKPGQPTFTPSVTSKTAKKSFTVTSSTIPGADGFEVQYSVRSDWWRASTVDFDGTNGKLYRQTIKTYHSNKKYYIRVRAYQVVDGAKVYSDWSPVKTATTK